MKKVSLIILVMGFELLWLQAMNEDKMSRFFFRRLPSVKSKDYFVAGLLLEAVIEGDLEKVQQCVDKGANVNTASLVGRTPLHEAVCGGHAEIVQFLIEERANLNAKDGEGKTPLNLAKQFGLRDIAKLLLAADAYKKNQQ